MVILSKYPEFKVYLTQDRAWKERYHHNMFDAVARGYNQVNRSFIVDITPFMESLNHLRSISSSKLSKPFLKAFGIISK